MKNLKKIVSLLLLLSLAVVFTFSFTSCTTPEEEEEESGDGKVTYTVTVVDDNNYPIPSVKVQLFLDDTVAVGKADFTDENGTVSFSLKEGNYSAKVVGIQSAFIMPEGYFDLVDNKVTIEIEYAPKYKVTVLDAEGAPVAGVFLQLCDELTCYTPATTNENGVAEFVIANSITGDLKAQFNTVPEGFELPAKISLGGATEITVTLVSK